MMGSCDIADMILPHLPKGGHGWVLNVVQNSKDKALCHGVSFERVMTQTRVTYDPYKSKVPEDQKWNA